MECAVVHHGTYVGMVVMVGPVVVAVRVEEDRHAREIVLVTEYRTWFKKSWYYWEFVWKIGDNRWIYRLFLPGCKGFEVYQNAIPSPNKFPSLPWALKSNWISQSRIVFAWNYRINETGFVGVELIETFKLTMPPYWLWWLLVSRTWSLDMTEVPNGDQEPLMGFNNAIW